MNFEQSKNVDDYNYLMCSNGLKPLIVSPTRGNCFTDHIFVRSRDNINVTAS